LLRIEGIECGYGRIAVLRDFNLSLAPGETLAIFGPNGAGKSTLLKAIAGAIRLWRGTIALNGIDVTAMGAEDRAERGAVLCPEGRHIFSSLTVEENLRIGATVLRRSLGRGYADAEREGIDRIYAMFRILRERRGNSGGALSGGQQQMLAIGRALMARPKLLLLDEPSLGLAPRLADEFYATLTELKKFGMTIIVVEESAGRPLRLADRGILLRRGRVVREGPAADLMSADDLGAAYLGEH
jgi:branched-chain amino acid transport system ATP-binding protein